jgi:hypothetical protein
MSIEIETLIDTYTTLKEYIPVKERQAAADSLMSVIIDALNDLDIAELVGIDSYLKRSYEAYADDDADSIDDDYDYED